MALGKGDNRQITRIFFPHMAVKGQSPAISSETMTLIYESCLRVAVMDVYPLDASQWPLTYSLVMALSRDKKGLLHFGTRDLGASKLPQFGRRLLELFQQHEHLSDAFFVHELRGTKGRSHHDPKEPGASQISLSEVLHIFHKDVINRAGWFVDVALEISRPGHVMQWVTSGHRRVLEYLLPSAGDKVDDVLRSKLQFLLDLNAQLSDIGGFRALPGSRGRLDNIIYINVYSTDKNTTYTLHEGPYRRHKGWHLFPMYIKSLISDMEKIGETFRVCGGSDTLPGLPASARMEVRVPIRLAETALCELPDNFIEDTLVSLPCSTFWCVVKPFDLVICLIAIIQF